MTDDEKALFEAIEDYNIEQIKYEEFLQKKIGITDRPLTSQERSMAERSCGEIKAYIKNSEWSYIHRSIIKKEKEEGKERENDGG